jgi:hypothetical protein
MDMFRLASEPLSIGKVLDNGIKLYLASFKQLIPLMIILAVIESASIILLLSIETDLEDIFGLIEELEELSTPFMVTSVLGRFLFGAMVYMMWQIAKGNECSNGLALKVGLVKLLYMVIAFILVSIVVGLGFTVIIPGFILIVTLWFTYYLVILENANPFRAMGRSHQLVWGNFWRTMVVLSVAGVIMTGFYLLTMLIGGLGGVLGTDSAWLTWSIAAASGITSAVLSPLYHGMFIVCYHDLVLRHEGSDLSDQIDSLST